MMIPNVPASKINVIIVARARKIATAAAAKKKSELAIGNLIFLLTFPKCKRKGIIKLIFNLLISRFELIIIFLPS